MSMHESDLIERLHAVAEGFEMPPTPPAADARRGRRRVHRNRALVAAAAVASVVAALGVTAAVTGQDRAAIDGPNPAERPQEEASFTEEELREIGGEQLGLSSDGTKLLVRRSVTDEQSCSLVEGCEMLVVNADGSEQLVAEGDGLFDGTLAPDGSVIAIAGYYGFRDGGLYIVDTDGGTPQLLRPPEVDAIEDPAFSPNGTQIAYFDGSGDSSHSLRIVKADGTGLRILPTSPGLMGAGHMRGLAWSPDGQQLIFETDMSPDGAMLQRGTGLWIIGTDGSGLTRCHESDPCTRWLGSQ
jgi:Tol biopolymer transport system component